MEGVTDSGKVAFSADLGIRADSTADPEAWQKAITDAQDDPMGLQNFLKTTSTCTPKRASTKA